LRLKWISYNVWDLSWGKWRQSGLWIQCLYLIDSGNEADNEDTDGSDGRDGNEEQNGSMNTKKRNSDDSDVYQWNRKRSRN